MLILPGAAWTLAAVGNLGAHGLRAERSRRQAARDAAQQSYDQLVARARQQIGPDAFAYKKLELARLRDEYQRLPERERAEIANLHVTAEGRQKNQFLNRHFIDAAAISGVGSTKKAALRSFGIETAADVTWNKVIAVKGFGEVLTRAVVDWAKACERRFVFDTRLAATDADKNVVRAEIARRKRVIEVSLNAGVAELHRLRHDMTRYAATIDPMLREASRNLAQARADFSAA